MATAQPALTCVASSDAAYRPCHDARARHGRLPTVDRATEPGYCQVIKSFEEITGVPGDLNTSFNENKPIVCTPEDALECFSRTKTDAVVIGNWLVQKNR